MSTFSWARNVAKVAVLTVVFAAGGTGVALAGDTTSGDGGVVSGNQVNVPVFIPISICGNAVAVLGEALGVCTVDMSGSSSSSGSEHTSGDHSIVGGNQINVPVHVPVHVCGNAIAVLGKAAGDCTGQSSAGSSTSTHSHKSKKCNKSTGNTATHNHNVSDNDHASDNDQSGSTSNSTPPPGTTGNNAPPPGTTGGNTPPPGTTGNNAPPPGTTNGQPGTTSNGQPGTTANGQPGTTDGQPGTTANGQPGKGPAGVLLARSSSVPALFSSRAACQAPRAEGSFGADFPVRVAPRRQARGTRATGAHAGFARPSTVCPSRGAAPGRAKPCLQHRVATCEATEPRAIWRRVARHRSAPRPQQRDHVGTRATPRRAPERNPNRLITALHQSKCPDRAYDPAPQGCFPAAVCVQ